MEGIIFRIATMFRGRIREACIYIVLALFLIVVIQPGIGIAAAAGESPSHRPAQIDRKIGKNHVTSIPAWPDRLKPPQDAPNVVLILLDDLGFGATSTFGGPVSTPKLDALAAEGLRYNAFNTTGLCAPSRAALLTGRNQHQVGFGSQPELAAGFPGYNGIWKPETASIARMLKDNGYSTAAFGKWHNTPEWEISPAGPFDRWPTGLGFEYFYGFMSGMTSQWEPRMHRGTSPVENESSNGEPFHLTTAMTDDAIHWTRLHSAVAPEKPFFLYFAPGAIHAPLHVPQEWIDRYRGKFAGGWDQVSEEIFRRQKEMGIIPAHTVKTPRPEGLPAWDSLSADERKLFARQMEVYAAYLSHTDHEVGRLLEELNRQGIDRKTLVIYVVGDNGESAEAGPEGSDRELVRYSSAAPPQSIADQLGRIDDLGSRTYDNHYAAGWAWATSTPFKWMKLAPSHFGATRNGLVIKWPDRTSRPDVVRPQFSHIIDIAPTILEAAGLGLPEVVDGVRQLPFEGKSLLPTFHDPAAPDQHHTQYFEAFGNRAIYKDGWVAAAKRFNPWLGREDFAKMHDGQFAGDKWELYNVSKDYSQAHDLAGKYPEKLEYLKSEFDREARRNNVYPLVPRPFVGTPTLVPPDKTKFVYYDGVGRLGRHAVPRLDGRSHKITAELLIPAAGANGVILALGGRYGGFSIYAENGHVVYENNSWGIKGERIVSSRKLPAGKVKITTLFLVDPVKSASGDISQKAALSIRPGLAQILIDNEIAAKNRFSGFGDFRTSITETFDVGQDTGSPVSKTYESPNAFNGSIDKVTIELIE